MVSSRLAMSGALLLLMVASARAAEPETMWYKDRLPGSASSKARAADYYEKAEVAHQCLQMTTYQTCKSYEPFGTCNFYRASGPDFCPYADGSLYYETDLGCCGSKADKHKEFFRGLGSDAKVGRCWWKLDLLSFEAYEQSFPNSLPPPSTDPVLEGTFEVTCELAQNADKCGEPLCEDTVLKGWGKVWLDYNAAILDTHITTAPECKQLPFELRTSPETKKATQPAEPQQPSQAEKPAEAKTPVDAKTPAKTASADYYSREGPTLYSGRVRIFSGYAQVISPSRKVTYKEGAIQAIGNFLIRKDSGKNVVIDHVTSEFVAKPYSMHIALRKGGDY